MNYGEMGFGLIKTDTSKGIDSQAVALLFFFLGGRIKEKRWASFSHDSCSVVHNMRSRIAVIFN